MGNMSPFGRKTASGKNVVDQEAMNSTVAVLERVQENESIGDGGGMNHGGHVACVHALVGADQAFHQVGQIFRLRTCEVNLFFLPGDRLADIILGRPVVGSAKPRIDNAILKLDQSLFLAKVFSLGQLKQRHEALDPVRGGLDVFDLEGGFRLLGVEVAERPLQQFRRIGGHHLPASLGRSAASKPRRASVRRTVGQNRRSPSRLSLIL